MVPLTERRWLITENYFVMGKPSRTMDLSESTYLESIYTGDNSVWSSRVLLDSVSGCSELQAQRLALGLWLGRVIEDGYGFPVPWFSFTLEF